MGCDINLYVEAKVKGEWKLVYGPLSDSYMWLDFNKMAKDYKISAEEVANQFKSLKPTFEPAGVKLLYNGVKLPIYRDDWLYPARNRILFGFLAGAGLATDILDCIIGNEYDSLRGFPKDASKELKEIYGFGERYCGDSDGDWFNRNWLTYKELLDFDLDKPTKIAVVKYIKIKDYAESGYNSEWLYDPNNGKVYKEGVEPTGTIVNVEQANDIIDTCHANKCALTSQQGNDTYAKVYVKVYLGKLSYRYYLQGFYDRLKILDGFAEPENIRLVYWFDN